MAGDLEINVLLFAGMRQTVGANSLALRLTAPVTVGDIRRAMLEQVPELANVLRQSAFAVDEKYASDATDVGPQATVACIPPVSGG